MDTNVNTEYDSLKKDKYTRLAAKNMGNDKTDTRVREMIRKFGGINKNFILGVSSDSKKKNDDLSDVSVNKEFLRFENIVSFGDAASDIGNYLKISTNAKKNGGAKSENLNRANRVSYYNNGRFSEGKIWIDHLGDAFGSKVTSYAVGYSTVNNEWITNGSQVKTGKKNKSIVPGLRQQVESYAMSAVEHRLNPNNTLYTIWCGANDLAGISIPEWHSSKPKATISDVLDDMVDSLKILINHPNVRAKNILFLSVLPADLAPVLKEMPKFVENAIKTNTAKLLELYPKKLSQFENDKSLNFAYYDSYTFLSEMFASSSSSKYGIKYNTLPCFTSPSRRCTSPHNFFWYDNSHVGSTTHLYMALDIIKRQYRNSVVG
ncbi:Thermolabile hemolysin [Smittium culicis]|uniref:Thermolabile hemolysin n=1 Tax=Smittium culicis TaxID=133412 RepID=A0A1R1YN69_9FUNG|nr:Thermolabile hemolysin [Smittium culicis]